MLVLLAVSGVASMEEVEGGVRGGRRGRHINFIELYHIGLAKEFVRFFP